MQPSTWQEELTPLLRFNQAVVAGLVVFCIVYAVVAMVDPAEVDAADDGLVLTYTCIGFAVMSLIARAIVPTVIVARCRKKIARGESAIKIQEGHFSGAFERVQRSGDAGKMWMVFFVKTMVSAGIIDGAVMVLLVAFKIGRALPAMIAAAVMTLILAVHIPTRDGAFRWIENELALMEHEQHLAA